MSSSPKPSTKPPYRRFKRFLDEEGNTYYYNVDTQESVWEIPETGVQFVPLTKGEKVSQDAIIAKLLEKRRLAKAAEVAAKKEEKKKQETEECSICMEEGRLKKCPNCNSAQLCPECYESLEKSCPVCNKGFGKPRKGKRGGRFPTSINIQDIENVRKFLRGDAMFSLLPQRLTSYLGLISLKTLPMPFGKIYVTLKRQGRREEDIDDELAQLIQSNHPMFADFIKAIKEDLAEYDLVNTTVSTARSVLDGQGKKRSKRVPFQGPPAEVIMPIGQGKCRCKC